MMLRSAPWPLRLAALLVSLLLSSCSPTPPPYWVEGGASLPIPQAEWTRNRGAPVLIAKDGRVTRDGELLFNLDAAGRVFDDDNEAMAILGPDGHVFGTNEEPLGRVGLRNASPPWSHTAWLRVGTDGVLMLFDGDGQPAYGGSWQGCGDGAVRACTLVSHLLLLDALKRQMADVPYNPVTIGVGVGVWY